MMRLSYDMSKSPKRIDILISKPNKYENGLHIPGNGITDVDNSMLEEFLKYKERGYFWPYDVELVRSTTRKHYFKFTEVPLLYPE